MGCVQTTADDTTGSVRKPSEEFLFISVFRDTYY